ncbi:MAG: M48 family metallopeptidase [Rickettsiales bacterium]|jgi:predicted metal-dependent hydrolase|nr:M48 family metallopeptidase [Rickettsiales bacterium]
MSDEFTLLSGEKIPVIFTTRRGLKNICVRPRAAARREIRVSVPAAAGRRAALNFMESRRGWLEKFFANAPAAAAPRISPGDTITIFGSPYECPLIACRPEFYQRRVRDKIREMFLIRAREIIRAAPRGLHPTRLTARDTTSRWGSCSASGAISLSWRLAFAPPEIMRYVILHELAHRRFMNHSPEFWNLVGQLYDGNVAAARRWLNNHGAELHNKI